MDYKQNTQIQRIKRGSRGEKTDKKKETNQKEKKKRTKKNEKRNKTNNKALNLKKKKKRTISRLVGSLAKEIETQDRKLREKYTQRKGGSEIKPSKLKD